MDTATPITSAKVSGLFTTTRPTSSAHGVAIATIWPHSRPLCALVYIDGSAAMSITGIGGAGTGPEVWGYRSDGGNAGSGGWYQVALLNKDDPVTILGTTQGYSEVLQFLGAFERLAIVGTPSTGSAVAFVEPLETV